MGNKKAHLVLVSWLVLVVQVEFFKHLFESDLSVHDLLVGF